VAAHIASGFSVAYGLLVPHERFQNRKPAASAKGLATNIVSWSQNKSSLLAEWIDQEYDMNP